MPNDPRRIGKYVVGEILGSGAMGVVYAARHSALGREVAIKVLRAEFAAHAQVADRFRREAEVVSRIDHANIVAVYDSGPLEDGGFYYAMERIRGETLTSWIERGPIAPELILRIVEQVCRALQAAHAAGVVHRDLKPDNIMLIPQAGRAPHLKVVDFGVAKLREAVEAEARARTEAGMVLGTPAYMAPEQLTAATEVDARADLYALGAILYKILTGQSVFSGTPQEVLLAHAYQAPEPPSRRSSRPIPLAVERVVLRALAKRPDDRPRDAGALFAELEAAWVPQLAEAPEPRGAPAPVAPQSVESAPPPNAEVGGGSAMAWRRRGLAAAALALILGGTVAAIVRGPAGHAAESQKAPAPLRPSEIEAMQVLERGMEDAVPVQRAALEAVAASRCAAALPLVMTALDAQSPPVRTAAVVALAEIGTPGDPRLLPPLVEMARTTTMGSRAVEVGAARLRLGDEGGEAALRAAIAEEATALKLRAAWALADAGRLDVAALRAALEAGSNTSTRAVRVAASAWMARRDPSFAERLRKEAASGAGAAELEPLMALARSGDAMASPSLFRLAEAAPDPIDRADAAAALVAIDRRAARTLLLRLVGAADAKARARAAVALGLLREPPSPASEIGSALATLLRDNDQSTRCAAAAALLATRTP